MTRSISPTQAARAGQCMHAWHLECHGDASEKVAPDAGALARMEAGIDFERECFESLEGAVEVKWDGRDFAAGHAATVALMKQGVPWIYQAVLVRDDVRGLPDLLRRVRGRSLVGAWKYEPVDIKSHSAVSAKDRVQLQIGAYLLEPILGKRPARGAIWLSTGKVENVKLAEPDDLLAEMRAVRDDRAPTVSVRCGECNVCPWQEHCGDEWSRTQHSTLIYKVTGASARKLVGAGLITCEDVAKSTAARLARRLEIDREQAKRIHLGARAWVQGNVVPIRRAKWPKSAAVHFYDIETLGDAVYLHGLVSVAEGTTEQQTLARTPTDERRAWHEFLEMVAALPEGPIYTWTDYERGFVEKLWARHQGHEPGYQRLVRDLVDLCAITREHFALPTSTYSLKKVAPLFGFTWQAEDAGGLAAGTWYEAWLANPSDEAMLKKVTEYNLDDVRAMVVVWRGLREGLRGSNQR